jgi:peptidoglycan/LPS O-acetylase OafA/YrhL
MSAPADRYHALDSLRGFAMFLGVALHAAISFMTKPPPFWSVHDANPTPVADLFLFAVHDFRMQTFFLLAGFFGCLLYQKYGVAGTAWHRIKRVAVPLVLAVVFIIPTVVAVFFYAELDAARTRGDPTHPNPVRRFAAERIAANPESGNFEIIADQLTDFDYLTFLPLAHLWFLYYLLFIYASVLLAAPVVARLSGTRLLSAVDGAFRWLVECRWRGFLLAAGTVPFLMAMRSPIVDTPLGWVPEWQILLYYFGFFVFGWMLYRHRALVATFGRGWGWRLLVANVVVLPVALGLTLAGFEAEQKGEPVFAWRLAAFTAQALYTWLMIVGLWGAFLHWFARESARVRYLADASYWCYLASITPTVAFQFVVKDWPLPGLVKWVLVTAATVAVLLASYEWGVRYTFIGAILNGRKYRTGRGPRSPKSAEREPVVSAER